MSIKRKLILFMVIATILPAVIVIGLFYTRMSAMLMDKNVQTLTYVAKGKALSEADDYDKLETDVFNLCTNVEVISFLKTVNQTNYRDHQNQVLTSEISAKLESFLDLYPTVRSLCVFPVGEGIPLLRGEYDRSLAQSYRESQEYKSALTNSSSLIKELKTDKAGASLLSMSIGISDRYSEKVVGLCILQIDLAEHFSSLNRQSGNEFPYFAVSPNNHVLFKTQTTIAEDAFLAALAGDARIAASGAASELTISEKRYILVKEASSTGFWSFVYCVSREEIMGDVQQVSVLTLALTLIFAVFSLAGAAYLLFKIYAPIHQLTRTMLKIQQGSLDLYVEAKGTDEFSTLGRAFNQLIDRVKALLVQTEETQKKKAELEMNSLQAQITPHFLYNALNSIKALARLKRNEDIIQMSGALIDLLRLSASKAHMITLREEIEYVQAYIQLMSYRTGIIYQMEIDVPAELMNITLPKFTLQPILENSILHGFSEGSQQDAQISIRVSHSNGFVCLTVKDNGKGITKEQEQQLNQLLDDQEAEQKLHRFSGIGINNIRQKLALEFGAGVQMRIIQAIPQGTTVEIIFPEREMPTES